MLKNVEPSTADTFSIRPISEAAHSWSYDNVKWLASEVFNLCVVKSIISWIYNVGYIGPVDHCGLYNVGLIDGVINTVDAFSDECQELCNTRIVRRFRSVAVAVSVVSRRTSCYGRRTTCSVREDKVCPPSLSKSSDKACNHTGTHFHFYNLQKHLYAV